MSKNNNPLYKALQDHTRKRISLEEWQSENTTIYEIYDLYRKATANITL